MYQKPCIHIVDDDEPFRKAISRVLECAGYQVETYGNAGEFLLADIEDRLGCILLDYRMPGPDGLELQTALMHRTVLLPTIFLSGYGDVPTVVKAMKAGAIDFICKPVRQEKLLSAIKQALSLYMERHQRLETLWHWQDLYETLSPREVEVFDRVVAGKLNKQIATEIGASERTVKAHRASIMEKMQANSLAELVQVAVHLDLYRAENKLVPQSA